MADKTDRADTPALRVAIVAMSEPARIRSIRISTKSDLVANEMFRDYRLDAAAQAAGDDDHGDDRDD